MFAGLMAHIYASDTGKTPTGEDVEKIEAESLITTHLSRFPLEQDQLGASFVSRGRWPSRGDSMGPGNDANRRSTIFMTFIMPSLQYRIAIGFSRSTVFGIWWKTIMFAFPHFSNVRTLSNPSEALSAVSQLLA